MRDGVSELEVFLQQLWLDWQRQDLRNDEYGMWRYTDEYFYPLYGIGNLKADIMAVGRAPAWNIDENEFGIERELKGPPSEDPEWDPDVDTVAFSEQAEQFETDRLAANEGEGNNLVKAFLRLAGVTDSITIESTDSELADNPFHSIYFTNYRKDGEFDSNDRALNEEYDFWEPILACEVQLLQPTIILTFGQAVTQRVARILGDIDISSRSFRSRDACLELWRDEQPYILPSIHWSGVNRNAPQLANHQIPNHLMDTILGQDGTPDADGYFEALGVQIDRVVQ